MILYREKDLDEAYKIDCKARTKVGEKWITLEEFRPLYEDLLEHFMKAYSADDILAADMPEYLIDSVNDLLETTITIDK